MNHWVMKTYACELCSDTQRVHKDNTRTSPVVPCPRCAVDVPKPFGERDV